VRHIAARVAYGAGKQHVRGDVSLRAAQLAQHAAYVRILDAALEQAPGLHHLMTRVVHSGGGVVNGTDEREFIGMPCGPGEDLADLDAVRAGLDRPVRTADLGRRVGLQVEGIEMAGAAVVEDDDAGTNAGLGAGYGRLRPQQFEMNQGLARDRRGKLKRNLRFRKRQRGPLVGKQPR